VLNDLSKFFATPKGLLIIVLVILAAMAAPHEGLINVLPNFLGASVAAGIVDVVILRLRKTKWEFPSGAILTAMITTMVLRSQEHWYVAVIVSVFAVLSKYVIRSRSANVFNPAALAVVVSYHVFHTGQSWWGSLPNLSLYAQSALLILGLFITDRVNKMPLVLVFLGTYFTLFTATAYVSDPRWVAEIYRAPDLQAALYFAFIILTDPPTSPAKYPDQIIFGIMAAVVAFLTFEWAGVVYFLLAGVLVGNVWEAWRRTHRRSGYTFPRGIGAFVREISPWRHHKPPTRVRPWQEPATK
jgi:Na+-translocating ferredoxin:NAD+ oxidoreductase RnfD subunit